MDGIDRYEDIVPNIIVDRYVSEFNPIYNHGARRKVLVYVKRAVCLQSMWRAVLPTHVEVGIMGDDF